MALNNKNLISLFVNLKSKILARPHSLEAVDENLFQLPVAVVVPWLVAASLKSLSPSHMAFSSMSVINTPLTFPFKDTCHWILG